MKTLGIAVVAGVFTLATAAQGQILDPSFEETGPGFGFDWNVASTNFGTPLCDFGTCGAGGSPLPAPARTGDWWAWFGGIADFEEGSVDQTVALSAGTTSLEMYVHVPVAGEATDFLAVQVDGTDVYNEVVGNFDPATYGVDYQLVSIDISTFAGQTVNIAIVSTINGAGQTAVFTNFFVEDVNVVEGTSCYADCDGSGGLNILDYICFGDDFAAGGTYADCDGSGGLNILDYICFGDEFALGCP